MGKDQTDARMTQQLQRSLEWATASTTPPDPAMDPCSAELREAWVAWAHLLERAEQSLESDGTPLARLPTRPRRRFTVGLALVAVVVTVALGTIWFSLSPQSAEAPSTKPEAALPGLESQTLAARASPDQNTDGNNATALASADSKLGWEDTVDNDLVELSQRLIGVQQAWRVCYDPVELVWCGIAQFRSEIESEPL